MRDLVYEELDRLTAALQQQAGNLRSAGLIAEAVEVDGVADQLSALLDEEEDRNHE